MSQIDTQNESQTMHLKSQLQKVEDPHFCYSAYYVVLTHFGYVLTKQKVEFAFFLLAVS